MGMVAFTELSGFREDIEKEPAYGKKLNLCKIEGTEYYIVLLLALLLNGYF